MSSYIDGGPAFPQPSEQRYSDPIHGVIRPSDINGPTEPGMSLRDYFAANALARLIGLYDIDEMTDEAPMRFAVVAYQLADAMLKARE